MSSTRLFVGNLPDTVTESNLSTVFSEYGHVVNVDFKNKSDPKNNQKHFAFVTISTSNYEIESCIKRFATEDFHGQRLFVTRARESFLERLQRERQEAQNKNPEKNVEKQEFQKKNPVLKLSDKLNPRKRKLDTQYDSGSKFNKPLEEHKSEINTFHNHTKKEEEIPKIDKKKQEADKKRMESIKRKSREFKEKQKIIKTGLVGIDKVTNKKVIFSDSDDDSKRTLNNSNSIISIEKKSKNLFDDNDSGDEVNFEIKKQFEGKKGQKVLDLQSRYKSDKRFILDERFVEDGESEEENNETHDNEEIDLENADEKTKQLNILEDLLGVSIKPRTKPEDKKYKSKLGMFRYDPLQPEHAKFLAPVDENYQESAKRTKKKKSKENQEEQNVDAMNLENDKSKIEVSKEQFYKVSDTLKESLDQPVNFSLRSLFCNNEDSERVTAEQDTNYISIEKPKEPRFKNPLNPSDKNPFVYDSSDSEMEDEVQEVKKEVSTDVTSTELTKAAETKIQWKENLFFSMSDSRLLDGLAFFNNTDDCGSHKERRELKAVMKKRIYNKDRKSQMFQKKIGGRKKSMKKTYRKKSNIKN